MERQSPPSLSHRRTQPQAHQVPPRHATVRPIIPIRCPGVQDVCIAQELNVPNLENHVQFHSLTNLLQSVQRVKLLRRQRGYDPLVAESRETPHVIRIPFAVNPLLLALLGNFEVENTRPYEVLLPPTRLPLPIKIPHRPGQKFRNIWVFLLQNIPHVMHTGHVALPALFRARDAQQADDIAVVGMEELPGVRAVDAHFVDPRAVFAEIFHMAEYVTAAVLRDRVADVCAQPHVCDRGFMVSPVLHREAFVQDEALAVQELVPHRLERGGHAWEGEVRRVYPREREFLGHEVVGGGRELVHLLGGEDVGPCFRVGCVVGVGPDGRAGNVSWEGAVRVKSVVEGWVLAGRFETVGEDGFVDGFDCCLGRMRTLGGWVVRCFDCGWCHACWMALVNGSRMVKKQILRVVSE